MYFKRVLLIALLMACSPQIAFGQFVPNEYAMNKWHIVGNLVEARYQHAASNLPNGDVLISGGKNEYNFSKNSTEIYSIFAGTFTSGIPMLQARSRHASIQLNNGKIMVIGGEGQICSLTSCAPKVLNSVEIFDPNTQTWSGGANLAIATTGAQAHYLFDGRILLVGGFYSTGWESDSNAIRAIQMYQPSTNTWQWEPMPDLRYHYSSIIDSQNKLAIVGGRHARSNGGNSEFSTPYLTTLIFNPGYNGASSSWANGPNLDSARIYSSAFRATDITILGGASNTHSMVQRSPSGWTAVQTNIFPYSSIALVGGYIQHFSINLQEGKVLTFGGSGGDLSEIFTISTGNWIPTSNELCKSANSSSVTYLATGDLLVTGGLVGGLPINNSQIFVAPRTMGDAYPETPWSYQFAQSGCAGSPPPPPPDDPIEDPPGECSPGTYCN